LTAEQQAWLKRTELDRFELFNLRTDLSQSTDLSAEEPERFASMRSRLTRLHAEVVAEGPEWEFTPE